MKKILCGILGIISLILAFRIGKILIYDIKRLTEYGFGYLTGLIIIFLIVFAFTVVLGFKLFRKKRLA